MNKLLFWLLPLLCMAGCQAVNSSFGSQSIPLVSPTSTAQIAEAIPTIVSQSIVSVTNTPTDTPLAPTDVVILLTLTPTVAETTIGRESPTITPAFTKTITATQPLSPTIVQVTVMTTTAATPTPTQPTIKAVEEIGSSTSQVETESQVAEETVVGYSVDNRPIINYRLGNGADHIVLIGGIHGGYEWNTTILAYEILDHLSAHPHLITPNLSVHIIPSANPDGLHRIVGKMGRFEAEDVVGDITIGRFNANQVDLNRNWDCLWQPTSTWRSVEVSAGTEAFSEPEVDSLALLLLELQPKAVIWWHSAANAVFAGGCPESYAPSVELGERYGTASGYPFHESFTHYAITGDASDWLATQSIPSISVELLNHTDTDFEQNRLGVTALLTHYGIMELPTGIERE